MKRRQVFFPLGWLMLALFFGGLYAHVVQKQETSPARERSQAVAETFAETPDPFYRPHTITVRSRHPQWWQASHNWAHSSTTTLIRTCESHSHYGEQDVNNGVAYYGAYQMNQDFWQAYGFPHRWAYANQAPPRWQDLAAYRGFLIRGYEPWECAP